MSDRETSYEKGVSVYWTPTNMESAANLRGEHLSDIEEQLKDLENKITESIQVTGSSTEKDLKKCYEKINELAKSVTSANDASELMFIGGQLLCLSAEILNIGTHCRNEAQEAVSKIRVLSTNIRYDVGKERNKNQKVKEEITHILPEDSEGVWKYLGTVLEKRADGKFILREGSRIYYKLRKDYDGTGEPEEDDFVKTTKIAESVRKERYKIRKNENVCSFLKIKHTDKISEDSDERKLRRRNNAVYAVYELKKAYPLPMTGISTVCSVVCGYTTRYLSQRINFHGEGKAKDPLTEEEYERLKDKYGIYD